ncbi:hypothetical protein KIS1582_4831 [Cytobacillus firmus]|uniref:Uncharacterized protein n=1 Tax=Cytobacillus firmus TaxID=1399 RepID=A0A800MSD3_CYTFI|nr:hypothetical protein KIS1582_4831 [Cytobacillus firmus]
MGIIIHLFWVIKNSVSKSFEILFYFEYDYLGLRIKMIILQDEYIFYF